ncbi:Uncharacterized protein APZ42_034590 [Daphnia magna]|uniref:Uncharacterized protein n=1 Tax=Daphnia magna TaxID=35525 RepID=A0A164K0F3_9CRUS|nr:Uncharacterized protein APZ42_034590 [Daphnia magna]
MDLSVDNQEILIESGEAKISEHKTASFTVPVHSIPRFTSPAATFPAVSVPGATCRLLILRSSFQLSGCYSSRFYSTSSAFTAPARPA